MPKLWYGQPASARDGRAICLFRAADKCKTRYATLASFGRKQLTNADEARIAALVKRAVS